MKQLSGGLITLSYTAESPGQAVSRLGLVIEQARCDIVGVLPDYETRMAIASEEFDQLAALAVDSESPEESMYLDRSRRYINSHYIRLACRRAK